jgi:segregation and condensation protein B
VKEGESSAGEDARTTAGEDVGATGPEATEKAGAGDEAAVEAEAKRAAKLREREVRGAIKQALDELMAEYSGDERGIEIREIAGGYRMATKPQCHDAVRLFVKSLKPPLKLSLPALETLAVIAYKQPVTAPEVNEIRGVDSSGVFGSLLARKLIVTAGRKPVVGRPILYKTTREFLLRFGLKDVTELPSMEEFEKMAASEFEDETQAGGDEPATETEAEFTADMSAETEEAASDEPAETKENTPEAAAGGNE